MRKLLKSIPVFIVFMGYLGFAQNKPYPQGVSHNGSIKPSNVSQATMNDQVYSYYVYWKGKYLKNNLASLPGGYYVKGEITGSPDGYTPLGSSEGQGYGMIIAVLMAGKDPDAKTIYDGLFKTARAYRSSANSALMGWVVADAASAQGHFGSASDGDLDIAYSLILAHYQWGSGGSINYLEEAKKMITNGIKASNVTNGNRINLGDWQSKSTNDTRPSDWMIDHFRAFKDVTGDVTWDNVLNTTYSMVNTIQTGYSPSTGLLPDFATNNPVRPAGPNFLESENDGNYYYNACRTPLRVLMDYGHSGDARGKTAANNMINWAKSTTGGNPANFKAGYTLAGGNLSGNGYQSGVFIAPMVAAATCDAAHQSYLNSGWSTIVNMKQGYFEDSYNLLCQLYISGNWWKPSGSTPNVTPTASISISGGPFTAPASITINATATDSDGSVSKVEFFNGATKLGEDATSPYSFVWTNVAAGTYSVTAKATDNLNATGTSSAVSITVNPQGNINPSITLTAPSNGASFTSPASVTISANASDADGNVTKVEFFNGATKLGEDLSSPYSFVWSGVAAGTYSISAKATDNLNGSATTPAVAVTVSNPVTQTPFTGTPIPIPGKVQAENYDLGGQGVAFSDASATNEGGQYRSDAVDIEATTDAGTGYNVGWFKNGEWLEYTVDVTAAGNYNFQARVAATAAGKTFNLTLDGAPIGNFTIPNTGGWQNWQTVNVNNVALTAGQKILRVNATSDDFNLNYIDVVTTPTTNLPPSVSLTAPNSGATYTAPANISITANATDADGQVTLVEFYNGTIKIGEDATTPYSFTWTNVAAGTYSITAKATDNGGGLNTSTAVSVTVNPAANLNPTVSLTAPASGSSYTAPASITISANASDADGSVAKVEFYNGSTKIGEDASLPYSFTWTNVAAGTYSLSAKAIDNLNASATTPAVSITVTPQTNTCSTPAWSSSDVYTQGMRASRNGTIYEAKWWTQGNDPLTNSGQWDVWKIIGPCNAKVATSSMDIDSEANYILVGPNPSNGTLNVNLSLIDAETADVEIFTTTGFKIFTASAVKDGDVLNIGDLAIGTYTMKINAGNQVILQRIVKQ